MSKIICEQIEVKNFFSYGNQWTTLEFREGVNAIIGHDEDKDRSNGAGKTSIIEAIPFALFGQTSKEVSLNKIINWKNGKNCEVRLSFIKDGVPYIIHRGIKPGILSLSKDGVDQPLLSDKRFFQKEIEQDLIGMDFRFAQMMTFQNANNMISMFTAKKEEKRKFIEKFFNLEVYTKMNELVNKKLGVIVDKLSTVERDIDFKEKRIIELQKDIGNTVTIDLSEYSDKLLQFKLEVDGINVDDIEGVIDEFKSNLESIVGVKTEIESVYNRRYLKYGEVKELISSFSAKLDSTIKQIDKIGDLTEQKSLYERVKLALDKMKGLDFEYEECKRYSDKYEKEQIVIESERRVIERDIKLLESEKKEWQDKKVLGSGECPTCFQNVDIEHIRSHIEQKISEITSSIDNHYESIRSLIELHKQVVDNKLEYTTKCKDLKEKIEKKIQLEKKLITLSNINEKEKELQELMDQKEEYELKMTTLNVRKSALEEEFKDETQKISDLTDKENEIRVEIRSLSEKLVSHKQKIFEYETLLSSYNEKKELVDKIELEYQVKVASKSQLEKEVTELKDGITKSTTLKDYLTYIKETLKDDNTKQYAISSIIPYLTQRTNFYLSETGHNYYIKLDNWMDGEICGSGVGECDFGNMSGGEGKSIDLALKFAMLDVARRQAGSYLDIMVLDELLDSSIDSFGLESLMNIVNLKQKEDNLKVYIVSHREEISDYGFDNVYKVTKKNGFSTIGEV